MVLQTAVSDVCYAVSDVQALVSGVQSLNKTKTILLVMIKMTLMLDDKDESFADVDNCGGSFT